MKKTIATMIALFPLSAMADDAISFITDFGVSSSRANGIYKRIKSNSQIINVDENILLTIAAQESAFKKNAVNISFDKHGNAYTDVGLMQINIETWSNELSLDRERLLHDDLYSIDVATIILKRIKSAYYEKEPCTWWSRFHSGLPEKRQKYEEMIFSKNPKMASCMF